MGEEKQMARKRESQRKTREYALRRYVTAQPGSEKFKLVYEHYCNEGNESPRWNENDLGYSTFTLTMHRHDNPKLPQEGYSRDWGMSGYCRTEISHFNLVRSAEGKLFSSDASTATLDRLLANKRWGEQGGWQMLETMVEEFKQTGKSSRKYESSGILDE